MSVNQSRAEKSESGQYRKANRSGNSSGVQRNYSGGGGKGSGAATAPTPSLSTNRSFKKPNNAQGSQTRVVNSDIRNDATTGGNVAVSGSARGVQNGAHSQSHGGSDAPVAKQNVTPAPKVNRGVPKAPAPNSTPVSSNTMAPSTPAKGGGFPLQFGSISPGLMQVPARTSSAPPNLDEQKREQARYESSRAMPVLPAQSVPKQNVPTNNPATSDQPNAVETHSMSKARRDVQVAPGPHAIQSQKPSVHPISGMPMQMPFHQQHIPVQFGSPNPQLQSQSMVNSSMPMPMAMPFPMGNPSQVQQQLYIQGLPPHMMPPQGVMHQGQGVNFSSQMGTQLPHMGNMGMNINPQFPQQQPGNFGGARKTVKITHPDTHEELSLSKKADTYKESGSSAPRSHTNIPPQSQPISSFPAGRPSNFYPNSYSQGSVFYTNPNSIHLSSNQVPPSSQAPRLYKQVTVKPAAPPRVEKIAESSLAASSHTVEKNIPKVSSQEGEATSIRTERDPEKTSDMSLQKSDSTLIPAQIKATSGVSDSASESNPLPSSISSTPEISEHFTSVGSSTTVVAKSDLLDRSNSKNNDEKHSNKSHSLLQNQIAPSLLEVVEYTKSSPIPEAQPGEDNVRESETTSVAVDLNTNSSEVQGIHDLGKRDGIDSAEMSADLSVHNKPKHEATGTLESRNILLSDEPNADAAGSVASAKSDSPRPYEHADQTVSLVTEVKDKQLKLETEPVHLTKGEADADLSTSISGTMDCLITETSSLSLGSTISHDCDKTSASDASTRIDDIVASTEAESDKLDQKSQILSVPSQSGTPCETEIGDSDSTELLSSSTDSKDKPVLETIMSKNTNTKKKRKEALQKADRAGTTADLYMAYKGPDEKKENPIDVESSETSSSHANKDLAAGISPKDVPNESKAEPDDWEDAADLSTAKLDDGKLLGEVKDHIEDKTLMDRKYSRDFLLKFSEQCKDLPEGFEVTSDIAEALVLSIGNVPLPSPGRNDDRSMGRSRSGRRGMGMGMGMGDDEKWSKVPGPLPPGLDMGYGNHGNNVFQPGANFGVLRHPRAQSPVMYSGGILSGPVHSMGPQYGMQRTNSDADKWQRATNFQRGLMPSPRTPAQVMHKAERKYEVGKITDEEQAKQRQLKAILNKLTPQNFERLFEQVKQVNIDNAGTLTGVISQIFDKALMEPTFCEMYADFCYHLAGDLPDFNEDNEKITFKRLLLNKCQEEFERGEREQEEANRAEEEGEVKQSDEEREEKRVQARRRMLGNIRLIGELYKKKMLTERIMHECIKKLLGQYQNPDEEDVEALCKLMSTIGEMIDHPKAKVHMDAYFDMMAKLSNNMKLSSRVRFMLKDSIDLRKNKWQQRRKVEGPKKIEEVHRDAANERQAQANRLARGPSMGSSFRRGQQPMDFAPRGSNVLSSPNSHMGGFRGAPQQPRGYATQDIRTDERHPFDNRNLLPQRPLGDSITLGPQGGLARGMSIRGQSPMLSPFSDMHNPDSRRTTPGLNGYGSVTDRPVYTSREELIPRSSPQRFVSPSAQDHMNITDGNSTYMNREPDRVFNRSRPNTPPSRGMESSSVGNIPTEKVLPEEQLRKKSLETIKEFYSAKDEMEVALCVKDLNAPSFYPSMISIWITDSFERKDMERGLLAKLLVNLAQSRDTLLSRPQLVEGFESVLACLEDAVTDAPKAPEFLGGIFAKFVLENVLPMAEIGRLIYEGGEQQGQLVEIGLAAEVLGSVLEIIKTEKGEQVVKEICTGSSLRLENFRPPNSKRALTLDKFI